MGRWFGQSSMRLTLQGREITITDTNRWADWSKREGPAAGGGLARFGRSMAGEAVEALGTAQTCRC